MHVYEVTNVSNELLIVTCPTLWSWYPWPYPPHLPPQPPKVKESLDLWLVSWRWMAFAWSANIPFWITCVVASNCNSWWRLIWPGPTWGRPIPNPCPLAKREEGSLCSAQRSKLGGWEVAIIKGFISSSSVNISHDIPWIPTNFVVVYWCLCVYKETTS